MFNSFGSLLFCQMHDIFSRQNFPLTTISVAATFANPFLNRKIEMCPIEMSSVDLMECSISDDFFLVLCFHFQLFCHRIADFHE